MKKITLKRYRVSVILDDDDYEKFKSFNWWLLSSSKSKHRYVATNMKVDETLIRLALIHREIMNAKKGEIVDHINGNTLDNRKKNLRIVTRQQNTWNSTKHKTNKTGYKGIMHYKYKKGWFKVQVRQNNKVYYLGIYPDIEQAKKVYINFVKKHRGEYAKW